MRCINCMNLRTKMYNRNTIQIEPFYGMIPIMKVLKDNDSVQVCWCSKGRLPRKGYVYPSQVICTRNVEECDVLILQENEKGVNGQPSVKGLDVKR